MDKIRSRVRSVTPSVVTRSFCFERKVTTSVCYLFACHITVYDLSQFFFDIPFHFFVLFSFLHEKTYPTNPYWRDFFVVNSSPVFLLAHRGTSILCCTPSFLGVVKPFVVSQIAPT